MELFLEVIFLLIVPVFVIKYGILPFKYRSLLIVLISCILAIRIRTLNISFFELGFRIDNAVPSLFPYVLFTALCLILLFLLRKPLQLKPTPWNNPYFLSLLFIPTSVIQEFIYRGYFQTQLLRVLSPALAIILVASLYAYLHVLWEGKIIIVLTFVAGLGWGILWFFYPNIYLLSLSHIIFNLLANRWGYVRLFKNSALRPA